MIPISGQKTVTAAGTAEALGSQLINAPLMIKALLANSNPVAVRNHGASDVTLSNDSKRLTWALSNVLVISSKLD